MGDTFRLQMDSDGNEVVGGSFDKAKQEAPTSEPIVRIGGERTRYDASTGEITVLSDGRDQRHETQNTTASDPLDRALSQAGMPVSRGRLTENDIVDYHGTTRVKELVDMGVLVKDAAGGFKWADGYAPTAEKPAADASKSDDSISLEGVPATTAGADLVHSQIRKAAGEPVYAAVIQSYITNGDPSAQVAEIARRTGQSEAEVREATDGIFSEFSTSAKAVAKANGVRNFDEFLAWASQDAPDAALDALHTFVADHDASRLGRLARQYSRLGRLDHSNAEILSASMGDGITAREVNGVVLLRIPGRGEMPFTQAVKQGYVRLT